MSYAKLASLADHHGLVIERRSYDRDSGYRGRLHKLKINMALSGEYRDIRAFLHALETSPEFIVIEHVSLNQGASRRGAAVAGRAVGDLLRRSAGWRLTRAGSSGSWQACWPSCWWCSSTTATATR